MLFVRKSYEILFDSNYVAITKLSELSTEELKRNDGFWLGLYYFTSYSVLCFVCAMEDRRVLKTRFA